MAIKELEDGSLEYDVWWSNGSMMVRRDCLEVDHPQSLYNYLSRNGYIPEKYGVYHQEAIDTKELMCKSKEELVAEVFRLRKELEGYHKAGY